MATLVTGLGYLGVHLAHDLLDAGEAVVGLENFFSTDEAAVANLESRPRFRLVRGSVTDLTALAATFAGGRIARVYHLAAQASAHPDAASPEYTEDTNLRGVRLVLEAARAAGVKSFIFGSSFRVYGERLPAVVDEQTPYGRIGDLSHLSKVYVEKLMEMYTGLSPLSATAVRLAVVYGPSPVMKRDARFMTVVNKFCLQAARGEPLTVHGAGPLTAFIHVADACRALQTATGWDEQPGFRAVNAVGDLATIRQLAGLVAEAGARHGLMVQVAEAAPPLAPSPVTVHSSLDAFGFRATRSLPDGIEETLTHFLTSRVAGGGPGGVRA